jgi:hypothetical protein
MRDELTKAICGAYEMVWLNIEAVTYMLVEPTSMSCQGNGLAEHRN